MKDCGHMRLDADIALLTLSLMSDDYRKCIQRYFQVIYKGNFRERNHSGFTACDIGCRRSNLRIGFSISSTGVPPGE